MPAPLDVNVVIVSYNTGAMLASCLTAVHAQSGITFDVTVTDNASSDGSANLVSEQFPTVRLIRNAVNLGFAAAANQAMAGGTARTVLLLNPDTLMPPASLAAMATYLDAHPAVGIVGPRLVHADGSFQSAGNRFPTIESIARQTRTIDRLLAWLGRRRPPEAADRSGDCDWLEGACLLVRREALADMGPLDERFFLFAEEMDWCHAARDAGWRVVAMAAPTVVHHRSASTNRDRPLSLALLTQANLQYFQKRRGVAVATLIAAIQTAGFVKQLGTDPAVARAKLRGVGRWIAGLAPRA